MPTHADLPALRATLLAALLAGCNTGKAGVEDDDDSSTPAAACEDPQPVLDASGAETGFVRCADGALNRVEGRTWPDGRDLVPACEGTEETLNCETDADCTERPGGVCAHRVWGGEPENDWCSCVYTCTTDADCDEGRICLGDGVVGKSEDWPQCVSAQCETGDDCASGECGIGSYDDGCGRSVKLGCRDSEDTCRADAECEDIQGECSFSQDDGFTCRTQNCDEGRPLVVDGVARTAPVVGSDAWAAHTRALPLDPAAAARWLRTAQAEHASVASFARVVLELMALGAPSDLLASTQQAMADEIHHARLAFGLATAFGGAAVGPGPLDLHGVAPETDAAAVLRRLVIEACVNETLCTADAMGALGRSPYAAEQAVLTRIVADETRHAALAWRTLGWLLASRPGLRPVAAGAFAEARARFAGHSGWDAVVGPCAEAALAA